MITTAPETQRTAPTAPQAPFLRMPDWGAAGWAGLIAGTAFMVSEIGLLPWSKGGAAWVPVRMVAATIYGRSALPPPPYFTNAAGPPDSAMFFLTVVIHYALALIYARILSTWIYKLDGRTALAAGAAFGLALYLVNFHGFTAVFPWFAAARGWVSLFSNFAFGVIAAACYKALERREPLMEDEPG
jgi:hypothetical protein